MFLHEIALLKIYAPLPGNASEGVVAVVLQREKDAVRTYGRLLGSKICNKSPSTGEREEFLEGVGIGAAQVIERDFIGKSIEMNDVAQLYSIAQVSPQNFASHHIGNGFICFIT